MVRNFELEKYIKRYTGKTVKVHTVKWIKGGYGASMNPVRGLKICKEDSIFRPLIWHEMGHLMGRDRNWVKNEVKAQKWALKNLKRLGYNRIYKESIEWVKRWGTTGTISDKKYKKASKIILKGVI